jgi:Txe/YoeB family toxin of toxin-antitoxin system
LNVQFSSRSWAEYLDLHAHDAKLFTKLSALIEECRRSPFKGTGKPEPLGGNLTGWWSRRINHEHRLVYRVVGSGADQMLHVAQCRYHYRGSGIGVVSNAKPNALLDGSTEGHSSEADCTHSHPVPPEEIGRYSPTRDPDSEQDIARYVELEADGETVQYVERIKTEYVAGEPYEVWDVVTDQDRWWVLTNITNLYSQKHFPSLDYTLSFHIGLMMRLRSRRQTADSDDPHPLDEVFRRQAQAADRLDRAVEAVDFQAVAMQMRECLLALSTALRRVADLDVVSPPKESDFKAWIDVIVGNLCSGSDQKELRSYLKNNSEKTWVLVNWLTHYRKASKFECDIMMNACGTLLGDLWNLLERKQSSSETDCPVCASKNIRSHFDAEIEHEGGYYATCGVCGWTNHPQRSVEVIRKELHQQADRALE